MLSVGVNVAEVPFADIKTSDLEHRVSVDFGGPIS